MKNNTRVTFTHPQLGTMTGCIEHDPHQRQDLFFPDEVHHDDLLNGWGIEPEAGFFITGPDADPGIIVTPL